MSEHDASVKNRNTTRRDFGKRLFGAALAGITLGMLGRGDAPKASAAEAPGASLGPASLAELLDESVVGEAKKVIKAAAQPALLDQVSEDGRKYGILGDMTGYWPDSNGRIGIRVEGGK